MNLQIFIQLCYILGSILYLKALKNGWKIPSLYEGFSQHSYETQPMDTKFLSSAEVLRFRDESFKKYYTNPKYLDMIQQKFGPKSKEEIEKMTKIKLKRRLLGD